MLFSLRISGFEHIRRNIQIYFVFMNNRDRAKALQPWLYLFFDCKYISHNKECLYLRVLVTRRGLEPRTHGLKGSCSTN